MEDAHPDSEILQMWSSWFTFWLSTFSVIKMRTVTTSLGWDKEQLIEMNTKPFEAKRVHRLKY